MNKAELKKQATKLLTLFVELHDKNTHFEYRDPKGNWGMAAGTPDMLSNLSLWRVADDKLIIDMSKIVDSDILCEFKYSAQYKEWEIGKLKSMKRNSVYVRTDEYEAELCRIMQNHIHFYNGEGNPLPDGLLVLLYYVDKKSFSCSSQDINWDCSIAITGYEVIDTLPEYKYAWEK